MTDETIIGSEICLVIEAGPTAADRLTTALEAINVNCVIIDAAPNHPLDAAMAKPLVDLIQARSITALLVADAQLARALRADGVHLPPSDTIIADYENARDILGNRYVVGAHAGKSRHDAMSLGEANADYIAFGAPAFVKDRETALRKRYELASWWAEIFEVPCVAFDVTTPEEARELSQSGVEFIAIPLPTAISASDQNQVLKSIASAIAPINPPSAASAPAS